MRLYIRSIYSEVEHIGYTIHGFADDHQVYMSFEPMNQRVILVDQLQNCINTVQNWMNRHYLQLNAGKTKLIVVGAPSVLEEIRIKGVLLNSSECDRLVSCVKKLGVILDSNLTYEKPS